MHPTFRADQFMIDHKTGKVWHLYAGGKIKMIIGAK